MKNITPLQATHLRPSLPRAHTPHPWWLRAPVTALLLTCGCRGTSISQGGVTERNQSGTDIVSANEFILIDTSGRARMRMHIKDAEPVIDLYNGQGEVVATLNSNGDAGVLNLNGPRTGSIRLNTRPLPIIEITDAAGTPLASMGLGNTGEPLVKLRSTDGRLSAEIRMDHDGKPETTYCEFSLSKEVPALSEEMGTTTRSLVRIQARASGGTDCELSNKYGVPIIGVGIGDGGIPFLECSEEFRDVLRKFLRL